jgi:3-oxoacyl-[acyl-carrier-protein] synthase II
LRKPDYDRRVVVTGLGVISPVGNDVKTAWSNLVNGVSGLGPLTKFDTTPYEAKLGGEVQDFNPVDWMDAKAARRSESSMHFGVAAAKQALADSGF